MELLILLPLFCRYKLLKKEASYQQLFGVAQDILLVYEQILLIGYGGLLGIFLTLFMQVYLLADAFLGSKTGVRMQPHFCAQIIHGKNYIQSAKALGILPFLFQAIIVMAISSLGFFLKPLSLLYAWICFPLALWSLNKKSYWIPNILIREQYRLIKKLDRKQRKETLKWTFPQEKYRPIHKEYPLLRQTKKFTGEKLWNLQVNEEKPHIVFIIMESFRALNVGSLGCTLGATPRFDALSEKGILFSDFYSNSVMTNRSLLCSLYGIPSEFKPTTLNPYKNFPLYGLPQILKEEGYQTSFLHNGDLAFDGHNTFLCSHGFSHLIGRNQLQKTYPDALAMSWGVHDEYLMKYAANTLNHANEPQLITLLNISNHHPFTIPESHIPPDFPISDPIYKAFLQSMHYSDWCLGLLFDELLKKKNCIFFIFGDHGQAMGEHGDREFIRQSLYEENIRVPLLIYAKDRIKDPKVISQIGSQVDLLPTVCDLLSLQPIHHSIGTSLMRKQKEKIVYFNNPYRNDLIGCRKNAKKLISDFETTKQFDLSNDPKELLQEPTDPKLVKHLFATHSLFETFYQKKCFYPHTTVKAHEDLSELDFSNNLKITDQDLKIALSHCKNLLNLNLSHCTTLTDHSLKLITEHCRNIHQLHIRDCLIMSAEGVREVVEKCNDLEDLNLRGVEITDATFKNAKIKPTLINLLDCPRLTDKTLEYLRPSFSNLHSLELDCTGITDQGLLQLKKVPAIRLILENGEKITDVGMHNLLDRDVLFEIELRNFPLITDQTLRLLKKFRLLRLTLIDTPKLTTSALESFKKNPELKLFIS